MGIDKDQRGGKGWHDAPCQCVVCLVYHPRQQTVESSSYQNVILNYQCYDSPPSGSRELDGFLAIGVGGRDLSRDGGREGYGEP